MLIFGIMIPIIMKKKIRKELRRQLAHALGIILVPLALAFGNFSIGAASLIFAFIIFILAEHRQYGNAQKLSVFGMPKIRRIFVHEKTTSRNGRKSVPIQIHSALGSIHTVFEKFERSGGNYRGAFYFYIASAVSLFLFSQPVALLSITVLALGDSFSTAVGIFGKNKIFYNRKKTWEGTLAGFAAAFAGCFLISPTLAFPAALVGMLVESLPLKIDDNLTIPMLTGIALSVIVAL